jgi:flagellar L-ring protein precursor FlgH
MNVAKLVTLLLVSVSLSFGARIFNLYTDQRAVLQGDLLTVLIMENAQAGTSTSTGTSKKSEYGVSGIKGSGALNFIPEFGVSGGMGNSFQGAGDTKREGSLVAKLSVKIEKVYDNGNLLITGNKVVEINEESEIIKLTGIVRPEDIEANNTIYSYNIADAQITYTGKGVNSDAKRAGPITRFFNWLM